MVYPTEVALDGLYSQCRLSVWCLPPLPCAGCVSSESECSPNRHAMLTSALQPRRAPAAPRDGSASLDGVRCMHHMHGLSLHLCMEDLELRPVMSKKTPVLQIEHQRR